MDGYDDLILRKTLWSKMNGQDPTELENKLA